MVRSTVETDQDGRMDGVAERLVYLSWLYQATPMVFGCDDVFHLSFAPCFEVRDNRVQEILDTTV